MIKRILYASFMVLLTCCSPKIIERTETKIEYRDRYVHDTATVEVPCEVIRNVTLDTLSHLENTYAKSEAMVSNGTLSHSLESKPQIIKVPVEVRVTDTVYTESTVITQTEYVEKELTKWQNFKMKSFGWLIALLSGSLLVYFRKPIFKFIVSHFA
jgi:hypothetical protein